jgi:CelD/BcsL family acetyltransferase involved in cellulose biosynthesis
MGLRDAPDCRRSVGRADLPVNHDADMIATPATDAVSVRIVDDVAAWDDLASAWTSLFEVSANAATPLQFDWLRTWWRIYMPAGDRAAHRCALRLFTFWRGAALVGVLPLYESRVAGRFFGPRRLRFVSTGEAEHEETCPDYMNLLAAPGEECACLEAFEAALGRGAWDCLELLDLPESSPLLALSIATETVSRRSVMPRGACPIADLDGGFEAYLKRLSANTRQQARRLLREAERCGAVLELATPATATSFFDDLVRLHQERWTALGKPGCFAAGRFTAFHRSLVDLWIGDGRAVLARLVLDGQAIAALYGFVTRSKFDFYQSGVKTQESGPLRSPGVLGHLLLMRVLCDRGVTRVDFLRGGSEYKERLATHRHLELFSLELWRSTSRATAYQAARSMAKAAWHAVPPAVRQRLRTIQASLAQ